MITDRDRKIVLVLIPLILLAGYWFLILSPKRAESQKVSSDLAEAQQQRDTAQQQVTQLNAAKSTFPQDYAAVVRLGKAIPTTIDMPSLLVQLDRAARGTGVRIDDFKPGTVTGDSSSGASGASGVSSGNSSPVGGGNNPAAAGAPPASGFPGKEAQKAGQGVQSANDKNQANAEQQAGVGSNSAPASGASGSAPGLVSVPLTFSMTGDFFSMADFFHRMKRFVRVVNDQIVVRGRLMTVDNFSFEKSDSGGSALKADVSATIYLSPANQGSTAGATSQGPATASGGASPAPTSSSGSTPSSPTPSAIATP